MINIHARTIGECWADSIGTVLHQGSHNHDGDIGILELLGLTVEIEKPSETDAIVESYGDRAVLVHTLRKFSKNVVMPDRPFTYGQKIYDKDGVDQFEWLVNRLKIKPETKSATICLLDTGDNSPHIPCLTAIDAKIRDGRLNLQFFYRSQNIAGRQYANLIALAKLQHDLASRLDLDTGSMSGYVASAHIYEYDMEFANRVYGLYQKEYLSGKS